MGFHTPGPSVSPKAMGFRVFNSLERRTALAVGTGLSAQVEATLEVKFDQGSATGTSCGQHYSKCLAAGRVGG